MRIRFIAVLTLLAGLTTSAIAAPTDRSFTYQGQLKQSGTPVSGNADLVFTLWDASSGGAQVGSTLTVSNATLVNGLFTVDLDFGPNSFNGDGRWLEVQARRPAGVGTYTTLSPRQAILPTPYALFALNGNPGATGPTGATGPSGAAGPTGATGAQGLQGVPGATGPEGPQGAEGPAGVGVPGPTGSTGAMGVPGPTGPTGSTGPTGAPGPDLAMSGSPVAGGPVFVSPTAMGLTTESFNTGGAAFHSTTVNPTRINATSAGRYQINATAAWAGHGGTGTRRLDLRVNGTTVIPGTLVTCQGVVGALNVVGNASWTVSLAQGDFVEVLTAAPSGTAGTLASAEVSVFHVTIGQEGPTGAAGPTGSSGPTGAAGPTGPQGVQGVAGATGATGPGGTGPTGATGVQGPTGAAGPTGPQGLDGLGVLPSGLMVLSESAVPPAQFSYTGGIVRNANSTLPIRSMSSPRYFHQLVELNGKIYSVGGTGGGGSDMLEYSISNNQWTALPSLPVFRGIHGAAADSGLIYILGGERGGSPYSTSVEVFVTATSTYTNAAPLPIGKQDMGAGVVGGVVYAVGGTDSNFATGTVFAFSGGTWTARATIPGASGKSCAVNVDGVLYHFDSGNGALHVYNAGSNTWTALTSTSARPRAALAGVSGRLFVFGGADSFGDAMDSVSIYEISTNSWRTLAARMNSARRACSAARLGDWMVVSGGTSDNSSTIPGTPMNTAEKWSLTMPTELFVHRKN